MSVRTTWYVGHTVTLIKNLTSEDWQKIDKFTVEHPEYERYDNNVKLICDGMNGEFARLFVGVFFDNIEDMSYVEFPILKLNDLKDLCKAYETFTNKVLDVDDVKKTIWGLWH